MGNISSRRGEERRKGRDLDVNKDSKEIQREKEKEKLTLKIVLVGPPSSGKTTLLYRLKTGRVLERGEILLQRKDGARLVPCPNWGVGFNHEELPFENVILDVWDLSGFSENVWEQFGDGCVSIVYVVDAANEDEVARAARSLWKLIQKEWFNDIPILVLTNKADQKDICLKPDDILNQLGLNEMLTGRNWKNFHVSVLTGDGLKDAFDWLEKMIREDEKLINRSLTHLETKRSYLLKATRVGGDNADEADKKCEDEDKVDVVASKLENSGDGGELTGTAGSPPGSPSSPGALTRGSRRNSSRSPIGKVVGSSSAFLDFFRSPRKGSDSSKSPRSDSSKSPRSDSNPSSPSLRVETPKSGKKSESSLHTGGGSMLLRSPKSKEDERKEERSHKEKEKEKEKEKDSVMEVRYRSNSDAVRVQVAPPDHDTNKPEVRGGVEGEGEGPSKRRSFFQQMARVETFINFGKKSDDKSDRLHSPGSSSTSSSSSSSGNISKYESPRSPRNERRFGLVQTKATTSKRVFVYRPLDQEGTALLILIGDTCQNFIEKACFKLGLDPDSVQRVLLMNGTEIQHIDELVQDDQVYIS